MKWTSTPPTEPGWYWHRVTDDKGNISRGPWVFRITKSDIGWFCEHWEGEWSKGPIPEPEDA